MNYELLRRKYLLLDTNLLIYYSQYTPFFQEKVFSKFSEKEITPIVGELVKFEFLRGAANPEEVNVLKDYLKIVLRQNEKQIMKAQFPITSDIFSSAIEIANIYSWKLKNNKISLADCMIAAEMKKYNEHQEQLYLATTDHDDFPRLFFKRVGIETIDTREKIFNVGFYTFDSGSYKKLQKDFFLDQKR